jgi:chromosome segregation ATPase
MTQESYADFSIIQKYLDQKKYHDEALKNHATKIEELEGTLTALRNEMNAKDDVISQLQSHVEEKEVIIKEREKSLQELNIQLHRLKQQVEPAQQQQGPQIFDDAGSKKAKFGFLK